MTKFSSFFDIFGVIVKVECLYEECLNQIKEHFPIFEIKEPYANPDIIVECDWKEQGKYLFRSRPLNEIGNLEGVRIRLPGNIYKEWSRLEPPLPPFSEAPLSNRFIGIHASCVADDKGNSMIIVGERGFGKSTLSAKLVKEFGYFLVTDELSIIHNRSSIVEPYPRPLGLWEARENGNIEKINLPATAFSDKLAKRATNIRRIIILDKKEYPIQSPMKNLISSSLLLKVLMTQHIDLGLSLNEGLATLINLSVKVPALKLTYSNYHQLIDSVKVCDDFFTESSKDLVGNHL